MYLRRVFIICLVLITITLSVYLQVGSHGFVNYDDDKYLTENLYVQQGLTHQSIGWAFTATYRSTWQPVVWLSFMLGIELYGMDPGWHHLTNVMLHCANVVLLFLMLIFMTGEPWRSAFVAALFAVHPLHVESVAWVAERKDVLSMLFGLLCIVSYGWFVRRSNITAYFTSLLFFVMGLMAKPLLVTLPFVLLLLDWWPLGRFQTDCSTHQNALIQKKPVIVILEKIPFFIAAAGSCVVTYLAQHKGGAVAPLTLYPLFLRVENALVSYIAYIIKMIWPVNLAVLYPHPETVPLWQAAGSSILLVIITFFAVKTMRKRPHFAVGWLWYLGTLVPMIGIVQIGSHAMADRFTYIPLIGLYIIIAWESAELLKKSRYRVMLVSAGAVIIIGTLISISFKQVGYWQNSLTLFQHAVDVTEKNYVAHNNLGLALAQQGKITEAVSHYSASLRFNPEYADTHYNMGMALAQQGNTDEAIASYNEAFRIDPFNVRARNNLGILLFQQGRIDEAIHQFQQALRIQPDAVRIRNNLKKAVAVKWKLQHRQDSTSSNVQNK